MFSLILGIVLAVLLTVLAVTLSVSAYRFFEAGREHFETVELARSLKQQGRYFDSPDDVLQYQEQMLKDDRFKSVVRTNQNDAAINERVKRIEQSMGTSSFKSAGKLVAVIVVLYVLLMVAGVVDIVAGGSLLSSFGTSSSASDSGIVSLFGDSDSSSDSGVSELGSPDKTIKDLGAVILF